MNLFPKFPFLSQGEDDNKTDDDEGSGDGDDNKSYDDEGSGDGVGVFNDGNKSYDDDESEKTIINGDDYAGSRAESCLPKMSKEKCLSRGKENTDFKYKWILKNGCMTCWVE